MIPRLKIPAFAEVRRGRYTHTISATRQTAAGVEVLLKFGPTLCGAIWAPLSEVTYRNRPIGVVIPDPEQAALGASIAAEERYWADQRLARRVDAFAHPCR